MYRNHFSYCMLLLLKNNHHFVSGNDYDWSLAFLLNLFCSKKENMLDPQVRNMSDQNDRESRGMEVAPTALQDRRLDSKDVGGPFNRMFRWTVFWGVLQILTQFFLFRKTRSYGNAWIDCLVYVVLSWRMWCRLKLLIFSTTHSFVDWIQYMHIKLVYLQSLTYRFTKNWTLGGPPGRTQGCQFGEGWVQLKTVCIADKIVTNWISSR